jgi:NAD(P)-dependent dehydrogenase (short-subunit alcohol dehydrogenase family)
MMRGLDQKVAVVTGGAGRIGRAVVKRLIEDGARVVVADIDDAAARAVAEPYGEHASAISFDAADPGSVGAMIEESARRFGRLDILHNNAAFVNLGELGNDTTALETPDALWDITMNINVRSYFIACRHAIPHMVRAGGGSIINTSSASGHVGDDVRIAYGTSKGAVSTLTLYLAAQNGKQRIRCNAIAPGMIADDKLRAIAPKLVALNERHNLLPRVGHPEDIASLVAFLASDESSFITGQIITIDGGSTSHSPQMVEAMELGSAYC